jgi:hypothetical protein
MIRFENHGPILIGSNFWESEECAAGKLTVSINAGAFRILLPPAMEPVIPDMQTARECLVSRGPWPAAGLPDAFEILFDDRTSGPYALHLAVESFGGLIPSDEWIAVPLILTVWTGGRRGKPRMVLERPCWYRRAPKLPYLKPREPA